MWFYLLFIIPVLSRHLRTHRISASIQFTTPFGDYQSKQPHFSDSYEVPCLRDEMNVSIEGLTGAFCSPICTFDPCPKDRPPNVTAIPTCDIHDGATGDLYCGLVCNTTKQCGHNATCKPIANTALCTYDN